MFRIPLLICLFTGLLYSAYANAPADSLSKLLNQTSDYKQKTEIYYKLIAELQSRNPGQSRKHISELENLGQKHHYAKAQAYAWYQRGVYYNLQGKFDSLKICADQCMRISLDHKLFPTEAMAFHLLGTWYWQTGKYALAFEKHLKALKIRESLGDKAGTAASLASLAVVSFSNNQPARAEEYGLKAIAIARRLGDERILLRCYPTLANVYGSQGEYAKALKYDALALKICRRTDNKRGFSEVYSNMATCYFYMGQYEAALKYHYKVLEIDEFFNDDKQIGDTYLNLAAVYGKKGDPVKAIDLLNKAVYLFGKTNYKYGLRAAYESLSQTYEGGGNFKKALNAHRKFLTVSNEINNEANDKHIAELSIQYESEKKEQQIKMLRQQSVIQELQIQERNASLLVLIVVLAGGLVIAYLFYNRRKLRESARLQKEILVQQQLASRAVMDAEERERRRIAGELHDGVGQVLSCALMNLSGLLETASLRDKPLQLARQSLELINEGYDELRSISHRMIPKSLMKAGLAPAIGEFLNKIDEDVIQTKLKISGLEKRLDAQTEMALYRVVQEAVTNVVKHAGASRIFIQLSADQEGVRLTIEDNGKGFDLSESVERGGIGLQNIYSRIEFLKGTVDLDTAPGKGTLLAIFLPSCQFSLN